MNEQVMNQMPYPGEENKSSKGPVIGTIVILIVLVLGAWYFWNQKVNTTVEQPMPAQDSSVKDTSVNLENDINAALGDDLGASESIAVDKEFTQ